MKKVAFCKVQASGNDFILLDARKSKGINYKQFAKKYCQRHLGVGADGLLVIESSMKALFKMRIFNSDGSEAEMCGNGARCVVLWARKNITDKKIIHFDTIAGIVESEKVDRGVKVKLPNPFGEKHNIPLKVYSRGLKVNFINTGVPHAVVLVQALASIDVNAIGREIRFHKKFAPAGVNVNFVELTGPNSIELRTYERGVEAETLACGTGMVASAIISSRFFTSKDAKFKVRVKNKSGETITVYFDKQQNSVWLGGKASQIYKGEILC
ncbi:MAG: diaminopimelate epimerase [Candidatus Omnitrophica bacterium]|nr:diaminopimelate epimerase [Candidatus Omnitrophota bacterium]